MDLGSFDAHASLPAAQPGVLPAAGVGPDVVAVGGGHGLSASLRAIRRYAGSVTAVVSVADDGGSSGRLRADHPEIPAPGDVRRCLGALAADGSTYGAILEHRYDAGDLEGHALGNLLLVALAEETGSFCAAVDEVAARVGAVGRVLPATSGPVDLEAEVRGVDGPTVVVGQVAVHRSQRIERVRLCPADPPSPPEVAEAILSADQVVIGPGSVFTSVLAAAVVPAVRTALASTAAQRVLLANLRPQEPETSGFTVADEVAAMGAHGIDVDVVVVDDFRAAAEAPTADSVVPTVVAPLTADGGRIHDARLLATLLAGLAADGPRR